MKSSEEIKKELHEYIDNIEDEETLWMVREDLMEYLKKEKLEEEEEEDYLTEDQKQQLKEPIRQAEAGEFVTEVEYQKAVERWRTK
jgi:predicted transcriptional regulator